MARSSAVVVSHGMGQIRKFCDVGAVLEKGRLIFYEDLEKAIAHHNRNMGTEGDDDDD